MLKSKLFKNTSIYVLMTFIQKGISFFLVPLYTVFLTPSEFGIVNQTIAISSVYILVIAFALDETAARMYFQYRKNEKEKALALGGILIISSILCVFGGSLVFLFKKYSFGIFVPNIPDSFIILSIAIVISTPIFSIHQKILRIREDAKHYSMLMLAFCLTQIFFSFVFLGYLHLHALGYMLSLSITSTSFGIYSFWMVSKEAKFKLSKTVALESFKYSFSIVPHTISSWGMRGFTLVALGKFLNSAMVGIYSAVNFVSIIVNVLSKSILDAYQPWLYKKLEDGKSGTNLLVNVSRMFGLFFIVIGFLLSLFSKEIITIFIDEKFHSGIYIVPILVYSSVVGFLGSLSVYILYYFKHKAKFIGISTIIGSLVNAIMCFILIPPFGILGGSISVALGNICISFLKQYFASSAIGRNLLYFDLHILTGLNLFISYFIVVREFGLLFKFSLFALELLVLVFCYRYQIYQIRKIICCKSKDVYVQELSSSVKSVSRG